MIKVFFYLFGGLETVQRNPFERVDVIDNYEKTEKILKMYLDAYFEIDRGSGLEVVILNPKKMLECLSPQTMSHDFTNSTKNIRFELIKHSDIVVLADRWIFFARAKEELAFALENSKNILTACEIEKSLTEKDSSLFSVLRFYEKTKE